jgi:cyanophycinase-like exopeptidase
MSKHLWKTIYSNARAAVKAKGKEPQRIYPYVGISCVRVFKSREYQTYLNQCAKFVLEFCGGVWLNSVDQGF